MSVVMRVSYYNEITDWTYIPDQVDGIIIKVGYRNYSSAGLIADTEFETNITEANDRDIPFGVYFTSQAITEEEAIEEADYVLDKISGYELSLPVFVESAYYNSSKEGRADDLDLDTRTTIISAFCKEVSSSGNRAGVYAQESWFTSQLDWETLADSYQLWIANYDDEITSIETYAGWEYTSSYNAVGVSNTVSLSAWYTTIAQRNADLYYFDSYGGTSDSIITALTAVGCNDTSLAYRTIIASLNGISDYSSTTDENTELLELLRNGLLLDPSGGDESGPLINVASNECEVAVVYITDNVYVSHVYDNDEEVTYNSFYGLELSGNGVPHTIRAVDAAGNENSETFSINGHDTSESIIEPTCTRMGYTIFRCKVCNYYWYGDYTDKTDHTYDEIVTEPTCTNEGYTDFTCVNCGYTYSGNYVAALGHDYVADEIVEATCTTGGYTNYVCSRCGESYEGDVVEALGHDWEYIGTEEGDCTTKGYDLYECSRCGETMMTNYTQGEGHTYSTPTFGWTDDYSTCLAYFTCSVCGYTESLACNVVMQYSDDICNTDGYTYYTATVTAESTTYSTTVSVETPAIGHDYVTTVVDPTCTSVGYTQHTCSRCEEYYRDNYTDELGHNYVAEEIVEPTCEEGGYTKYVCSRCNNTYNGDETDPTGHTWDSVITEPTCTERGYTTNTCTVCGVVSITNYVNANGHSFKVIDQDTATFTDDGYATYECEVCGYTYTDIIDALAIAVGTEVYILNTPLYPLPVSIDSDAHTIQTGIFYIWEETVANNRVKITNRMENTELPGLITGWVDIDNLNKYAEGASGLKYVLGDKILAKSLVVYEKAGTYTTYAILNGYYYISSQVALNGRMALTADQDHLGDDDYFAGWCNLDDL